MLRQFPFGLVFRDEAARIHVARTDSREERNSPAPAGAQRRCGCVGLDTLLRRVRGELDRHRPIAQQGGRERDERLAEGVVDEQPAEAGAVDKEVSRESLAGRELDRFYLAVALELCADDVTDDVLNAAPDGRGLQEVS